MFNNRFCTWFCGKLFVMRKVEGKYNKHNRGPVFIFVLTLGIILAVGIPALFIMKEIKNGNSSGNMALLGKWESIPEAAMAENAAVTDEESARKAAIIYEGDEDYTHVIETSDKDAITIGFAGDILFDSNYAVGNTFKNNGYNVEGVIGQSLLDKMRSVDVMMVNNEFPYSYNGTPTEGKTYTFRADPVSARMLGQMGVDLVGLANNHAYDYGKQALLDTFQTLNDNGISFAGAGNNIDEASHPVYYVTSSGMKVAIICATQIERLDNPDTKGATEDSPGVFRCFDDSLLLERVREAREKNAFVVVFIHWGTESTTEIDYLQRDQAAEIAQAGANVIIGAHPHILQKIDYVNGVPVVYSLGNYIFNSKTVDTGMVVVTVHTNGSTNMQFVPAIQAGCSLNEATGSEYTRILNMMQGMSPNINIDGNGYISPR